MTRKLRECIPFLGLGFAKRRRLSVICGDDLIIGFDDLLWRWVPAFGLLMMLQCRGGFVGYWIW